jgi:cytochrome c
MNKTVSLWVGSLALLASSTALANMSTADLDAARESFQTAGCSSCHAISGSAAGPSLKVIAKRYKGKPVANELAQRIRLGSQGRWGDLPHPAIESLDEQEARRMAEWILGGAR